MPTWHEWGFLWAGASGANLVLGEFAVGILCFALSLFCAWRHTR